MTAETTVSLPDPFRLIALDSIDSTNEEAKRLAAGGAPEVTVVWAGEQTAGKGRRGRGWVSPPGNLYCSLLLRPHYPATVAMQLGFVTAIALAEAVLAVLPRGAFVTCKWPNDVLVEGRKVAGILLESAASEDNLLDWLVVGVGLNVAHHPSEVGFPATSLLSEGAREITVPGMLETVCLRFLSGLVTWRNLGFASVRRAWLQRAHGLGEPMTAHLEGETLDGVFRTLGEDGTLVMDVEGVERRITAADVFPRATETEAR